MKVELKLFASLSVYASHPRIPADGTMELSQPLTVGGLIDDLGIPRQDIKLIFINGVHAHMESMLKDGDRLGIFPPIGGG